MSKQTNKPAKQEWIYTEDGPELKQPGKTPNIKVNKWYFFTPWIIWLVAILYLFYSGGNWAAVGFLLIVFGPVPITILNIKTFQRIYIKPLKSKKK